MYSSITHIPLWVRLIDNLFTHAHKISQKLPVSFCKQFWAIFFANSVNKINLSNAHLCFIYINLFFV